MDAVTNGERRQTVDREIIRHRSNLFAFILCVVRDFELAAAVLGELSRALAERSEEFETGTAFWPWALAMAREKTLERCRLDRREVSLSPQAIGGLQKAWEAEPDSEWREAVGTCLGEVQGIPRSLLEMRYRGGLSGAGIARRTKTTVTAVLGALFRARSALSRCAESRIHPGGTPP